MEAIFKAIPQRGRLTFLNLYDIERYCLENEGVELIVHMKEAAKTAPKMLMYAYYHCVILDSFIRGATRAGHSGIDKVTADYMLRADFAKDFVKGLDGVYKPILLDKSRMSKTRLHKFLQDSIFYIESNFEVEIPDSQAYKINKETGRDFKKT